MAVEQKKHGTELLKQFMNLRGSSIDIDLKNKQDQFVEAPLSSKSTSQAKGHGIGKEISTEELAMVLVEREGPVKAVAAVVNAAKHFTSHQTDQSDQSATAKMVITSTSTEAPNPAASEDHELPKLN